MSKSIHKHTTYTWTSPEGLELEIPWDFDDGSELFKILPGGRAILGSLTHDDSPPDPIEEYDEGEFVQFCNIYIHYGSRPDVDDWKRIVRANPGRVVTVDTYGQDHNYRAGRLLTVADTKRSDFEGIVDDADGYYIAPADVTDALQYADGTLERYSQWANGEVYGVCIWIFDAATGELIDREQECWGFIGYDYAQQELQEQFNSTI